MTVVVLPLPLGPIRAWTAPCRTETSTSSTALRPPKYFESPLTSSAAAAPELAGSSTSGYSVWDTRGAPAAESRAMRPQMPSGMKMMMRTTATP